MLELKAAPDSRFRVLAVYLKTLQVTALVAPYDKQRALSNSVNAQVDVRSLENGRFSVMLSADILGVDSDQEECVKYAIQMEALTETTPEHLDAAVTLATGLLLAEVRAKISAVSASTGFGTIVIPALKPEQLRALRATPLGETSDGNRQ